MTYDYGRALRILRAIHGLSQKELAARTGISASMTSLVERQQRAPSLSSLEKWAFCLGVDLHTLTYLASPKTQAEDILRRLAPPWTERGT